MTLTSGAYHQAGDLRRWAFPGLDFQVALLDRYYAPDPDHWLHHLEPHILRSAPIRNRHFCGNACSADDVTFRDLIFADPVEALAIFESTEQKPIAYLEAGTGLPFTTNGGAVIIAWDRGPNKIFALDAGGGVRVVTKQNKPHKLCPPSLFAYLTRSKK